jgi:hypothetical protein
VTDSAPFPTRNRVGLTHLPILSRLRRAYAQWFGAPPAEYRRRLLEAIDSHRVEVVVGYWGTNPIADAIAIKRQRPGTAVILNVLCHPQAVTGWRIATTDRLFRRAAGFVDGLIFPGPRMEQYFRERILPGDGPVTAIIPPCWPGWMQPARDLPPCGEEPAVLFLGRMDLGGDPTDNVSNLLYQLMDAGVRVYHCETSRPLNPHPNRRSFTPRSLVEVIEFATQFPASLIAYNTAAARRDDRFRLTVPDRLIASVAAGIPIALPAEGYEVCADYLETYGSVIRFRSPAELADRLRDRAGMSRLRELAHANRHRYHAEAFAPAFAALTAAARERVARRR